MIRRKLEKMRLTLLFTFVVLAIFIITSIIIAILAFTGIRFGLTDRIGWRNSFPLLFTLLPASVIVGFIVALVIAHIPLKPLRELIAAINQLASGDFSARIHLEHTLEFNELNDSFNRMATELGSIELLRSDFINNFSHEFKTPIVSIKGFAELLKMDDLPKPERDEYLDIIIHESSRLAMLATNVLNLSKVENQTIVANEQRYNLSEQLRRCVLLLQYAWENKQLQFNIDLEEIQIYANEELLSQVWLNLLDNAIKFSDNNGTVDVSLSQTEGFAQVIVRDRGIGIGPEDLPHIFEKFYQSDSSRALPGTGLGLALVKKIVTLYGGSVNCNSTLGQGSAFVVLLPLAHGGNKKLPA
jgi:signal transduction histidine kinase